MPAQQLSKLALATSDANGAATFAFESVPTGLAWRGNVRVGGAPFTATLVATVGPDDWGEWQGPLFYGPVQAVERLALTVAATGLTPNTAYAASWLGIADDVDMIGPASPAPAPATPSGFPSAIVANVTITATSYASGYFATSNIPGLRCNLVNTATKAAVVTITWYSADKSDVVAQRIVTVPAVAGGAFFTIPNLGDVCQITAANVDGSAMSLNLYAALHSAPITAWSAIGCSDASGHALQDVLISASAVVAPGPATLGSSALVYAGPTNLEVHSAASAFTISLEAQDQGGTWQVLTQFDAAGGARQRAALLVPATPLRVLVSNGDMAGQAFDATLTADSWRPS